MWALYPIVYEVHGGRQKRGTTRGPNHTNETYDSIFILISL